MGTIFSRDKKKDRILIDLIFEALRFLCIDVDGKILYLGGGLSKKKPTCITFLSLSLFRFAHHKGRAAGNAGEACPLGAVRSSTAADGRGSTMSVPAHAC